MRAGGGLDALSRRAALASAVSVASSGLLLPAATAAALPLPLELELLSQAEPYIVQPDSTKTLTPKVKPTSPDALVRSLVGKRAIFLGEHHNSAADHLLQAALIRRLHERTGGKEMAVGLEAVQRRFQPILDDYLAGRITEAELEEGVEWKKRWFWPFEAYVPVFRACRELGVSLLALNVDSEDLSKVEVGGLPALPPATLSRYISDRDGFASFASTTAFKEYVAYIIKPSYAMHQQMGILRTTITGQSLEQDMTFRNFFSGRILWDEVRYGGIARLPPRPSLTPSAYPPPPPLRTPPTCAPHTYAIRFHACAHVLPNTYAVRFNACAHVPPIAGHGLCQRCVVRRAPRRYLCGSRRCRSCQVRLRRPRALRPPAVRRAGVDRLRDTQPAADRHSLGSQRAG